ncbi:MAG: hypothetical protein ACREO3_12500 [Arenimonas sp.]
MERLYFHVARDGKRWCVRVNRQGAVTFFDRLNEAMDSAIRAASAQWEQRGRPTGVRLELPNGLCAEERTFGTLSFGRH